MSSTAAQAAGVEAPTSHTAVGYLVPEGAIEILPVDAQATMYEAWRDARTDGIGGSDVAALMGLINYKTEYAVWLDKKGWRPPITETPIMTRGRYAELMLAQWFADETGLGMRRAGTWAVEHSEHLRCNPDRFTSDGGVAEMKAPDTDDWGDAWKYGPAIHAVMQVKYCMAVTGAPHGYVIADGGRDGLRWWRIERDDAELQDMIEFVDSWWWYHVVDGHEPDVDRYEATAEAIRDSSPPPEKLLPELDVTGLAEWAATRHKLKDQIKGLKEELDLVENRIKAALRTAVLGTEFGRKVIGWEWVGLDSKAGKKPYRKFKEIK